MWFLETLLAIFKFAWIEKESNIKILPINLKHKCMTQRFTREYILSLPFRLISLVSLPVWNNASDIGVCFWGTDMIIPVYWTVSPKNICSNSNFQYFRLYLEIGSLQRDQLRWVWSRVQCNWYSYKKKREMQRECHVKIWKHKRGRQPCEWRQQTLEFAATRNFWCHQELGRARKKKGGGCLFAYRFKGSMVLLILDFGYSLHNRKIINFYCFKPLCCLNTFCCFRFVVLCYRSTRKLTHSST